MADRRREGARAHVPPRLPVVEHRAAGRRSVSTATRRERRAPSRWSSTCITPIQRSPKPTNCAASSSPCSTTSRVIRRSWPASWAGPSTTVRFAFAGATTVWRSGPRPFSAGSRSTRGVGPSTPLGRAAGRDGDSRAGLDAWAAATGSSSGARVDAPYQVGWCSWYHYFGDVAEADVTANLALATSGRSTSSRSTTDSNPRSATGWRPTTSSSRRSTSSPARIVGGGDGAWPLDRAVPRGTDRGRGAAASALVRRAIASTRPLLGMVNEHWGGSVHVLDTTQHEVVDHLEHVARTLVDAGFRYLKLDFTYAPGSGGAVRGRVADARATRAGRLRRRFVAAPVTTCSSSDVARRSVACIGAVDGMRIGPDVAPWWDPPPTTLVAARLRRDVTGDARTRSRRTEARQFMHRRLCGSTILTA